MLETTTGCIPCASTAGSTDAIASSSCGYLLEKGIQTRPLWQLNHLQTPFRRFQPYRIERAPRMLETTLNLPCSVSLTASDIDYVVQALRDG